MRIALSTWLNDMYGRELKIVSDQSDDKVDLDTNRVAAHVHNFSGDNIWSVKHVNGNNYTF